MRFIITIASLCLFYGLTLANASAQVVTTEEELRRLDNHLSGHDTAYYQEGWPRDGTHYVQGKYCYCEPVVTERKNFDGSLSITIEKTGDREFHVSPNAPIEKVPYLEWNAVKVVCDPMGSYEGIIVTTGF